MIDRGVEGEASKSLVDLFDGLADNPENLEHAILEGELPESFDASPPLDDEPASDEYKQETIQNLLDSIEQSKSDAQNPNDIQEIREEYTTMQEAFDNPQQLVDFHLNMALDEAGHEPFEIAFSAAIQFQMSVIEESAEAAIERFEKKTD